MQVLVINGDPQTSLAQQLFYIENIGKGGFRFVSDINFELEDRVQVALRFPDGRSQEITGRICYKEEVGDHQLAYGYSIIKGFYSL